MNDSQTEEPNSRSDNQQHPPLTMGFGFLPRLAEPGWGTLALLILKSCPKYYLKPAILLAFAFTAPYVEFWVLNLFIQSMSTHGTFNTGGSILLTFAPPLIFLLILSVGAFASIVWGLGTLLISLTATCRTILQVDTKDVASIQSKAASAQEEGIQIFRNKKGYLAKVWLLYSLLMLIPTAVMVITSWIVTLGLPQVGNYTMLPMPVQLNIPMEMMVGSAIALGASIIVLTNYALILLPFSAGTQRPASKAALGGFLTTLKTLPAISIYSVIFFVLSSLFFSPVDLLLIYNQQLITGPAATGFFLFLKFVWHVLNLVYFVPISILIPCEMIRGNVD